MSARSWLQKKVKTHAIPTVMNLFDIHKQLFKQV